LPTLTPDHLIPDMQFAADVLSAMGNGKRLLILSNLAPGGEISVNELAKRVGLGQNAVSYHLAMLRHVRLVTTRRDQQTIYYSCDPAVSKHINHIIEAAIVIASKGKDVMQVETDPKNADRKVRMHAVNYD